MFDVNDGLLPASKERVGIIESLWLLTQAVSSFILCMGLIWFGLLMFLRFVWCITGTINCS